jgi:glycerophosphoryl diester phosphodiesterase
MKKKHFKKQILLGIILAYLFMLLAPRIQSFQGVNPLRTHDDLPMMIAHGGGNLEFPDNTLEAYYHTYSIDPSAMLETDINMTKDYELILSHDRTLDRTTTMVNATISDVNYRDLVDNEIDFNYKNPTSGANGFNTAETFFPYRNYQNNTVTPLDVIYPEGIDARHPTKFLVSTLRQLIIAFPNNLINVEIKQTGDFGVLALEKTIELMEALDDEYNTFSRIVLASFHREVYQAILDYKATTTPELMYSPEFNGVLKFYIMQLTGSSVFYTDTIAALQLPVSQLGLSLTTRSLISTAHKHNIAVHYWTINDEATMRELIEKGVDGIMTDRPTLLKQVLDSYRTT